MTADILRDVQGILGMRDKRIIQTDNILIFSHVVIISVIHLKCFALRTVSISRHRFFFFFLPHVFASQNRLRLS